MDSGNLYAIPALISTIFYVILIFIVLKIDVKSGLNRISALFFSLLAMWSFFEWMLRWSDTYNSAFFWASMIFVPIILLPPVLLHMALVFPWSRKDPHPYIYGIYGISLIFLGIHLNSNMFITDMRIYYAGYGTVIGPYGLVVYLYLALFGLISLLVLMKKYIETDTKIALHQLKILIISLSISYILIFFTGLAPYIYGNTDVYPWTTPSFIIMGSVLAYAICRYHVFIPEPEKEREIEAKEQCSGVKILPREEAMAEFYEKVNSGNKGLCITARDPEETKEEMDLKKVPVVHIKKITGEKMDPRTKEGRSFIPFIITDTLMEKNTVMILDGMDQFLSKNEFEEFVDDMKSLELKDSMLIISTNGKKKIKNNIYL